MSSAPSRPSLIRDDPEWPMPTHHRHPSPRRLRVWRVPGDVLVAVITERGPGMSVTNAAEPAVTALTREYPGAALRVIEHYPDSGDPYDTRGEHFDEITLTTAGEPRWAPLDRAHMTSWLGEDVLDDMPELPPDPCV